MNGMRRLNDRYLLAERIGQGGVGEVYRGWQVSLERPVAIKLLRPEYSRNPSAVARFEREAATTSLLNHPNIVTVHDVGKTDEGVLFVVMELLVGQTLADRMGPTSPPAGLEQALPLAWQVIRAMGAAQGVGLVHRDLKPENLHLSRGGHLKVLDFGLATLLERPEQGGGLELERLDREDADPISEEAVELIARRAQASPRITRPGVLIGTPRYMAPEQVLGWGVDHRTDLYSFGAILFELLCGRPVFDGPGARDFMRQHLHDPPPPLHSVAPRVPRPIAQVVDRLLRKSPSERFHDWAELAEALRRVDPGAAQRRETRRSRVEEARPAEPYRFLSPFSASTGAIFFGRDQDAARFREAWEDPDRPPVVILSGVSGVGKTSFLAARVIPGLEDTGHSVLLLRSQPRPLRHLEGILRAQLPEVPPERGLGGLLRAWAAAQGGGPVAVVFDQVEELLVSGEEEGIRYFQAGLATLLSDEGLGARFLISLREDYLGALLRCLLPLPVEQLSRSVLLRPLSGEDLRSALEGPGAEGLPVRYHPFRFEHGLVEEISRDLAADPSGEVAPRVQAVGSRLWEMVRHDPLPHVIRASHYRERLGGARAIIARVLDEAIGSLEARDQGLAKEMLRALTHLPGSPTSRPVPEAELVARAQVPERRRQILRRLEDRWRILQGYTDPRWPEERTYRIAHEALIARIQEYGEEGTDRNRARQLFHHGYNLWLQGGRRDEDLLPEGHVAALQRFREELVLRSADEQRFYEESEALHNEAWLQRYRAERQAAVVRWSAWTLAPALLLAAGFLLGQAPSNYLTVRQIYLRARSEITLSQADLSGWSLRAARLDGLVLGAANLEGADLREASFQGASLTRARFVGADLRGASLQAANLRNALFDRCTFEDTTFDGANLRHARLVGSLEGASFRGALFDGDTVWPGGGPPAGALGPNGLAPGLVLRAVELRRADLAGLVAPVLDMTGARLVGASLFRADLRGARLAGADLSELKASAVQLRGADLRGVRAQGAQLMHADLRDAALDLADLRGADLTGARLERASLCGADLSTAELSGVKLEGSSHCAETRWPEGFLGSSAARSAGVARSSP